MNETTQPKLALNGSRLFTSWLQQQNASLAFTTYQVGKLFLIGIKPDGGLSVFERTFDRAMGLTVTKERAYMGTLYQLWQLDNFLTAGEVHEGHDALYVPTVGTTTGDIDIHEMSVDGDGLPVFVATRFNCIASPAKRGSFKVRWKPSFIDRVAAEDRCHLNGLAMQDGQPKYATCVSQTNVAEAWRAHRKDGGVVIDIDTDEVVAEGLSMPHSPRLYKDKLYLLQAGTGEFGYIDLKKKIFEPLCFLPGFARGLSFCGDYAVIGLSKPRREGTFEGLALNERLEKEGIEARCGLSIVNLKTGDVEHSLEIEGVIQELFDVAVIEGVRRPMALGFRNEEIRFMVRPEED
ncbi:MAG: TIGR03032 family protein [Pseudomonadota bacterium]